MLSGLYLVNELELLSEKHIKSIFSLWYLGLEQETAISQTWRRQPSVTWPDFCQVSTLVFLLFNLFSSFCTYTFYTTKINFCMKKLDTWVTLKRKMSTAQFFEVYTFPYGVSVHFKVIRLKVIGQKSYRVMSFWILLTLSKTTFNVLFLLTDFTVTCFCL